MTTNKKAHKAHAVKAPEDVKLIADLAGYLHCPVRRDHLEDFEGDLSKAASLSRAFWGLLASSDFTPDDKRSANAAAELASAVADHASAAEFIFAVAPIGRGRPDP